MPKQLTLMLGFALIWVFLLTSNVDFFSASSAGDIVTRRGDEFQLEWYTIDGGGGRSTDGTFQVRGTIGQVDTIAMVGEDFTLKGGFWPDPDMTNIDFEIFRDGFERPLILVF